MEIIKKLKFDQILIIILAAIIILFLAIYIHDRWFFYKSNCIIKNEESCLIGLQERHCTDANDGEKIKIYEFGYECICSSCSCEPGAFCDCISGTVCFKIK